VTKNARMTRSLTVKTIAVVLVGVVTLILQNRPNGLH
jgi:hypothetical protein